jgi:hypothetical protein
LSQQQHYHHHHQQQQQQVRWVRRLGPWTLSATADVTSRQHDSTALAAPVSSGCDVHYRFGSSSSIAAGHVGGASNVYCMVGKAWDKFCRQ